MAHGQSRFCILHSGEPHAEPSDLQPQEQRCKRECQEINESLNTIWLKICISKRNLINYIVLIKSSCRDDDSNYIVNSLDHAFRVIDYLFDLLGSVQFNVK